jgi:hypothetical protein
MMERIYNDFFELVNTKLAAGQDPLEIAAVMTAISMSIYRTVLEDDDYQRMIDSVSGSRDRIRPIQTQQLQ